MSERSVLRLSGERAEKKVAHWHSVAVAASEQCGGNRVPPVQAVSTLAAWLAGLPAAPAGTRLLLSLQPNSAGLREAVALLPPDAPLTLLSGPEGGLSPAEEATALAGGFVAVSLGQRTLRAETAALAALAALLLEAPPPKSRPHLFVDPTESRHDPVSPTRRVHQNPPLRPATRRSARSRPWCKRSSPRCAPWRCGGARVRAAL